MEVKKKRGRPRKKPKPAIPTPQDSVEWTPPVLDASTEVEVSPEAPKQDPAQLKIEAEGLLRGAFEVPATLLSDRRIALMDDEVEALAPSFTPIYEKYIRPTFGEKAELMAFALVFTSIAAKKIPMAIEAIQRKKKDGIEQRNKNRHYPGPERDRQELRNGETS